MALQIWLPLMGDVHNQGEYPVEFTNSNASVSVSGCIGSCYSFNASNSHIYATDPNKNFWANKAITEAVWFKCDKTQTGGTLLELFADLTIGYSYNSSGIRFNYWRSYTNSSGNRAGDTQTCSTYFSADVWHHIAVTFEKNFNKLYVDGQLVQTWDRSSIYTTNWKPLLGSSYSNIAVGMSYGSTSFIGGRVNDVRFYDHCLSAKEVKEISLGLAVHYKLETHTMKNIVTYPTFNTSSAGGGWNHWEPSGLNKGFYAQNTDKQYIFNKNNTYSHKVGNGSGSSYDYIMYQSPAYDTTIASGGCRTFAAIIKDEYSQPITNSICHPGWNAPNNSIGPVSVWNEITPLGDGFYLCKCEGLYQTGSNNLIGIQVKSGHTIYISEVYIENYATKMGVLPSYSESSDIMYDSSGYNRHGTHYSGTVFNVMTSGNGRYDSAIENATGYIGKAEVNMPPLDKITFSWWANYKVFGAQTSGLFSTSNVSTDPTDYNTTACNMRDSYFDMCNMAGSCKRLSATGIELNKWHHYCITYDGATERFYVDGVEKSTVAQTGALKDFKYLYISYSRAGGVVRMCRGPVSDFRIYCTALSAADVKEMYETAASVDNKGNFHCYELKEV